jgi:arylsulfatase
MKGRSEASSGPSSERPNILLILTDQQRWDGLGIYNGALQTPNLDALARSGVSFRRAYSEVPSCIAARRTLISGLRPATQGMVGFEEGIDWNPAHTLPGELARGGYHTHCVGKMHFFPKRKRFGFQSLVLSDDPARPHGNDYTDWLKSKGYDERDGVAHGCDINSWVGRPHHFPEELTHSHWCVSRAMEFVQRRDPTAPFFLKLSLFDPHPPLAPPASFFDRYIQRELPKPRKGEWNDPDLPKGKGLDVNTFLGELDPSDQHAFTAAYYATINHVDSQIGRFLIFLREQRVLDNTFILFTSDHGEMLGDHGFFRKAVPYEGSSHVPFIVKPPKRFTWQKGLEVDAPVGLQDVMPTLLEAAGQPVPKSVEGSSVLPWIDGKRPSRWREYIHGEHAPVPHGLGGMHYLTDGRMKYVWWAKSGREQLFDLISDPCEACDLATGEEARKGQVGSWRQKLIKELKGRPEGFTDWKKLIPGRAYPQVIR